MKLSREVVVSGLLLMCAMQAQCTLGPGLSTPEERAKVVALTRILERDPAPSHRWVITMNRGTVSAEFQGKCFDAEWRLENGTLTVSNPVLGEMSGCLARFQPAELARMLLVEMYFEAKTRS